MNDYPEYDRAPTPDQFPFSVVSQTMAASTLSPLYIRND
jgi:hypothetical protein